MCKSTHRHQTRGQTFIHFFQLFFPDRHNLVCLPVINKTLFDIIVHIKMMLECVFVNITHVTWRPHCAMCVDVKHLNQKGKHILFNSDANLYRNLDFDIIWTVLAIIWKIFTFCFHVISFRELMKMGNKCAYCRIWTTTYCIPDYHVNYYTTCSLMSSPIHADRVRWANW